MAWYGEKFREMSINHSWFISAVASSAVKEAEGSKQLLNLSERVTDANISKQIHQHAIDEAKHARFYVKLLKLAFPVLDINKTFPTLESELNNVENNHSVQKAPCNSHALLDELIQMNIGEIRTRVHQLLFRPVMLTYAPEKNKQSINKIMESLLSDETRHIEYTARLIEKASMEQDKCEYIKKIMEMRWQEFNAISCDEVEGKKIEIE